MVKQQPRHDIPSLRYKSVTICPCCGFKFEGSLSDGCESCGAQSVGEALPRPEKELPSYGRSLLLAVTGSLMVLVFLTQTIIALVARSPSTSTPSLALSSMIPLDFWSWVAAAETAAWRLKWIAIPVTIIVLWGSRKIYRSMLQSPGRFCGMKYARRGMLASALVPMLIAVLIGVTVPERLQQRDDRIEAADKSPYLTISRAQVEYQLEFGTLPTDPKDLARLPDKDGSIAAALASVDLTGYKVTADLAALPTKKPRRLRGAVILKSSLNTPTDDSPQEGLSFTNYELPMAGVDKLMGTDDDMILRDGIIYKVSEIVVRKPSTAKTTKP